VSTICQFGLWTKAVEQLLQLPRFFVALKVQSCRAAAAASSILCHTNFSSGFCTLENYSILHKMSHGFALCTLHSALLSGCMHVWMYVCMRAYIYVCIYVCMYVCSQILLYVYAILVLHTIHKDSISNSVHKLSDI
jgi:hypothetical protein